MATTLKFVYAIILFISLFLVLQNTEFEGKLFYTFKIYSFITLLFVRSILYCFINIIVLYFFIDYYFIECQRDLDCPQLNSEIFAFKCIEKLCKLEFIYQQAPFLLGQV